MGLRGGGDLATDGMLHAAILECCRWNAAIFKFYMRISKKLQLVATLSFHQRVPCSILQRFRREFKVLLFIGGIFVTHNVPEADSRSEAS